jgi:hypothetical protein
VALRRKAVLAGHDRAGRVPAAMSWWGGMRDWHAIAKAIESFVHGIADAPRGRLLYGARLPYGVQTFAMALKIPSWHLKANTRCARVCFEVP